MNKYQKILNKRAKRMYNCEENKNEWHYSYQTCRKGWKHAFANIKFYKIDLENRLKKSSK